MTRSDRDPLLRVARAVSHAGVWLSGALLVGAAGLVGVDVVLRRFFDMSVGGADEISGYVLAIGSAWAFGYCLLDRGHIRIDSIYVRLPARARSVLDVTAVFVFTAFMAFVTWHAWGVLDQSWSVGARSISPLATPLVIPQAVWLVGLLSVLFAGVALLARAVPALARGRDAEVGRLVGYRTLSEELETELEREQRLRGEPRR
ncbi:MAG TPA: TRAP transporter small permease [Candidatus Binatia bacterium]|nr:TRAP transporter small permease [Candidatus Binatia bacterium]